MEFSSLIFIFRFLPVVFLLYYLLPERFRNVILLISSAAFYTIGEPRCVLLILLSVAWNYFGALRLEQLVLQEKKQKLVLGVLVVVDAGLLLFFKYTPYTMPLGMSFYTFTSLSYILDVYFGNVRAERSVVKAGLYMLLFPKLISGPIARYAPMQEELTSRTTKASDIESGIVLFTIGLAYKVLLANYFGTLWHDIRSAGFDSISTPAAWIGAAGYSAQLFFDFQGYSLMAIGIGRLFGFHLPDNFRHPYRSKTVGEYYRRWHITLGEWFKYYVYIPLGGNRKGSGRTVFNLFVVWLLTGIWHGATLNFLIWGMALFVLIVGEKFVWGSFLEKHAWLAHAYIWILIPLTWVVFAIDNIQELGVYFTRLFPFWGSPDYVNATDYVRYLKNYTVFFVAAFLVSTPIAGRLYKKCKGSALFKAGIVALFALCLYKAASSLNNPFMYFRF